MQSPIHVHGLTNLLLTVAQIERLIEEAKSNDNTYREVLDQQEGEYESELKELIAAAEHEILNERENTAKVRRHKGAVKGREGLGWGDRGGVREKWRKSEVLRIVN